MIRVRIELVSAITGATSEIGCMYITNDGTGTADRGSYDVAVCRRGSNSVPRELYRNPFNRATRSTDRIKAPKAMRTGRVENYPRLAYNVWRLIARACLSAFPEEVRGRLAGATPDAPYHEQLLAHIDDLESQLEEAHHAGAVASTVTG